MKKRESISSAKKKAWVVFSKYIRLRDCLASTGTLTHGKCCSCRKVEPIQKLHAGHFLPGRRANNLFDTRGCHAQCISCNTYQQGNWPGYFAYMERLYGRETINELIKQDRVLHHWTVGEILEIRDKYKQKVKAIIEKQEAHHDRSPE